MLFDVFLFRFGEGVGAQLVDALHHKMEGFVFDSRYGALEFSSARFQ